MRSMVEGAIPSAVRGLAPSTATELGCCRVRLHRAPKSGKLDLGGGPPPPSLRDGGGNRFASRHARAPPAPHPLGFAKFGLSPQAGRGGATRSSRPRS